MIKCRERKYYDYTNPPGVWVCQLNEDVPDYIPNFMSCTHAERRDGLKECCETCGHLKRGLPYKCLKNNWFLRKVSDNGNLNLYLTMDKMCCSEWQPREEER